MEQLETVAVWWSKKFGEQRVRINRKDFDPKIHELVSDEDLTEEKPKPERAPQRKATPKPRARRTTKKGK
jgi:hypothetical protein